MGCSRFSKLFCRKCQSEKRVGFFSFKSPVVFLEEQEGSHSTRISGDVEFKALTVRFDPLAICQYTRSYPFVCLFAFHELF